MKNNLSTEQSVPYETMDEELETADQTGIVDEGRSANTLAVLSSETVKHLAVFSLFGNACDTKSM